MSLEESYDTERNNLLETNFNIINTTRGINVWTNNVKRRNENNKIRLPVIDMTSGCIDIKLRYQKNNNDKYHPFVIIKNIKKFEFSQIPQSEDRRKKDNVILKQL